MDTSLFRIRRPDDAPDVVSAIKHLFRNRFHTDFCFISRDGTEKHLVHKLIVAIQSPVLSNILYGNMPIQYLQIKYESNLALRNLISFFYNEDLVLENISDIKQTKDIADRYEVDKLGEICKEEIINIPISTTDVVSILETAKEFKNEMRENDCLRLIGDNQEVVLSSPEFLGLSFRRVLDIFEKIKKQNLMTEVSFLRSGIKWIDTNGATHNKDLLMEKVDVYSLQLDDYLNIIEDFPTFFSNIEISCAIKVIRSRQVIQTFSEIPDVKIEEKEQSNIQEEEQSNIEIEATTDLNSGEALLCQIRKVIDKMEELHSNSADNYRFLIEDWELQICKKLENKKKEKMTLTGEPGIVQQMNKLYGLQSEQSEETELQSETSSFEAVIPVIPPDNSPEEDEIIRWADSLQKAHVTAWHEMICAPDHFFQNRIRGSLIESGCPPNLADTLMVYSEEILWPPGLSTPENRINNKVYFDNFICKRVPGKQAVVIMAIDNPHMNDNMILKPGFVIIFAHGVE